MPNGKELSPIVKYVVAATGFGQREAWELLQRVSEEHYERIFQAAWQWDRTVLPEGNDHPIEPEANRQLTQIVGTERLTRLIAATRGATAIAASM